MGWAEGEVDWAYTGRARLWHSTDGVPLQGILYKPDGFDETQQYPMMVYFYERFSDGLRCGAEVFHTLKKVLGGRGLRAGQVIGSTDPAGEADPSDPVAPREMLATIYQALGVDQEDRRDEDERGVAAVVAAVRLEHRADRGLRLWSPHHRSP